MNDRFDKIDKKQDIMIADLHKIDVKFTKRVGRNTLICNSVVWFFCATIVAGLGLLVRLLI